MDVDARRSDLAGNSQRHRAIPGREREGISGTVARYQLELIHCTSLTAERLTPGPPTLSSGVSRCLTRTATDRGETGPSVLTKTFMQMYDESQQHMFSRVRRSWSATAFVRNTSSSRACPGTHERRRWHGHARFARMGPDLPQDDGGGERANGFVMARGRCGRDAFSLTVQRWREPSAEVSVERMLSITGEHMFNFVG